MLRLRLLMVVAVGVLGACRPVAGTPPTPTVLVEGLTVGVPTAAATLAEPATPSELGTSTASSTPTVGTTATSTPRATGTATPARIIVEDASGIQVVRECLDVQEAVAFEAVANGGVAVFGTAASLYLPYFLLNLETGTERLLPNPNEKDMLVTGLDVSPNRELLSFAVGIRDEDYEIFREQLWVLASNGEILVEREVNKDWLGFAWLDDEWMEVGVPGMPSGTLIRYNPFTDEWHELRPAFPNLYDYNYVLDWSDWTVQYSPDLEWAIYLTNPAPSDSGTSVVVWDMVGQRAVWQQPGAYSAYYPPKWSTSRQLAAVPIEGIIHMLDRDGLVTKLVGPPEMEHVQSLSWSPDERYIAYWTNDLDTTHNPYTAQFYVFDRRTQQIMDYCMGSNNYHINGSDAAWSPYGYQFVIQGFIPGQDGSGGDVLIDLAKHTAAEIKEFGFSGLWMKSE